mmetsp:Transcript_111575/g.310706  ORF Transcript_111575/g.310706 Transcript_111575/m.310706 type:complete len:240 (+) Transcript_111575:883-1602(+)
MHCTLEKASIWEGIHVPLDATCQLEDLRAGTHQLLLEQCRCTLATHATCAIHHHPLSLELLQIIRAIKVPGQVLEESCGGIHPSDAAVGCRKATNACLVQVPAIEEDKIITTPPEDLVPLLGLEVPPALGRRQPPGRGSAPLAGPGEKAADLLALPDLEAPEGLCNVARRQLEVRVRQFRQVAARLGGEGLASVPRPAEVAIEALATDAHTAAEPQALAHLLELMHGPSNVSHLRVLVE